MRDVPTELQPRRGTSPAWLAETKSGYGKMEIKERFPLFHTPDGYDGGQISPQTRATLTISLVQKIGQGNKTTPVNAGLNNCSQFSTDFG